MPLFFKELIINHPNDVWAKNRQSEFLILIAPLLICTVYRQGSTGFQTLHLGLCQDILKSYSLCFMKTNVVVVIAV